MPETEKCPECRHAPHDGLGFCPNMASDNDCACTHGAPAAPETETDANGLTEWAARFLVQCGPCDAGLPMPCTCTTEDERPLIAALLADLDAAQERVRVVEGERDAAREQGTRLADGLYQWRDDAERYRARAESAEAAHEAEKAAHERLRAGVEALADEWANTPWDQTPHLGCLDMYRHCAGILTTLLGGGGAR